MVQIFGVQSPLCLVILQRIMQYGFSACILSIKFDGCSAQVDSKAATQHTVNPIALRKAKTVYSFGLSECSGVKPVCGCLCHCSMEHDPTAGKKCKIQ